VHQSPRSKQSDHCEHARGFDAGLIGVLASYLQTSSRQIIITLATHPLPHRGRDHLERLRKV
jgi:hypothetical protein